MLDGLVIIVTGGAKGIGRAYCESLVAAGARVVVADQDAAAARALAGSLNDAGGGRALAMVVDVTNQTQVLAMAGAAHETFGQIDVLVNNAGNYPHLPFGEISYEDWRRVVAVNLDSVFLCSGAVLPHMKARKSGKIVNIATNLVWTGLANMVHYVAAKAGVVGFTRALAREVGPHGITVNALAPGAVVPQSRLGEEGRSRVEEILAYQSIKREQRATDLLGPLLFLCSPASDFITGQVITVDGGLTAH